MTAKHDGFISEINTMGGGGLSEPLCWESDIWVGFWRINWSSEEGGGFSTVGGDAVQALPGRTMKGPQWDSWELGRTEELGVRWGR